MEVSSPDIIRIGLPQSILLVLGFGPSATWLLQPPMSASGGKKDISLEIRDVAF
jgi:hypothetical protein